MLSSVVRLSVRRPRVRAVRQLQRSYIADVWPKWPEKWLPAAPPRAPIPGLDALTDPAIDSAFVTPPTLVAALVDSLHVVAGCSWFAAGVATTLLLRAALVPMSLRGMVLQHQLRILSPEALLRLRHVRDAFMTRDREALRFWFSSVKILDFDHGRVLTPLNHLIHPFLLISVSVSNILAARYLCATMPSMQQASFLWLHDFSARTIDVDPTLTLPLVCAGLQLAQLAFMAWPLVFKPKLEPGMLPPSPIVNRLVGGALVLGFCFNLVFTVVSPFFPQGVLLLHWLPSASFALVSSVALRSASRTQTFRRWINSRPHVQYAAIAAHHWRTNPLRALDFERLKRRVSIPQRTKK